MKKDTYTATINRVIPFSLEKVWKGMTNPEIIKQYFFGTDLVTTWSVGDAIYFRGEFEGKKYEDKGIIKEFTELERVIYTYKSSWSQLADIEENYLLVTYTFNKVDENNTELMITQTAHSEEEAKKHEENWTYVISEMEKVL